MTEPTFQLIPESLKEQIRLVVLHSEGPKIRNLLLNKEQIDLVLFINIKGKTTASHIARLHRINIQRAIMQLFILYKKGYLIREPNTPDGSEDKYLYSVKPDPVEDDLPTPESPNPKSTWKHKHTGNKYTVITVSNESATREDYPVTVVYQGEDGEIWSRPITRWYESMSEIEI